jgi:hypothetical protein
VTWERRSPVQLQIQLEHVDSWLSKNAQLTIQCVTYHNLANSVLTQVALIGNASDLKVRSGWRDVRIEP